MDENGFPGALFHSILMRSDWKGSPSSWTGMLGAFSAGFDRDATRKNPAPWPGSARACKFILLSFKKKNLPQSSCQPRHEEQQMLAGSISLHKEWHLVEKWIRKIWGNSSWSGFGISSVDPVNKLYFLMQFLQGNRFEGLPWCFQPVISEIKRHYSYILNWVDRILSIYIFC